jgi:hypothetical protein
MFGLAIFRETQVEGHTVRDSVSTGVAVVVIYVVVFAVAALVESRRKEPDTKLDARPRVVAPRNERAARIDAEPATLRAELERLRREQSRG